MPIDVTCPECFQQYAVKDSLAGKKIRCKECQGVIKVVPSAPADEELDEFEGVEAAPAPRPSRSGSARSAKATGGKRTGSSRSAWSEVPWKSAGIPLGIAVIIFALARIVPYPAGLFLKVLSMLTTLGCGLAGFYMLARVTSRTHGDVSVEHLHGVKRVGRVTGFGGGNAIIALLTLGFVFVAIKGMFLEPRKTVPWFLMAVFGVSGLVWTARYDRDAFKPGANQSRNQPLSDADWEQWKNDIHQNIQNGPPRKN